MNTELDKALSLAKQCNVFANISSSNKSKPIDKIVKEVLSLNPNSTEIGAGKLANLIQLAKEVEKECR